MAKKTLKVEALRNKINAMLNDSHGEDTEHVRQGYINVLESVLHDTGNYDGFRYLDWSDMQHLENELPGVNFEKGSTLSCEATRFVNTDETRRFYF